MNAIRIHRKLDSDTVPELKPWIGRTVEIIVLEIGGSLPAGFTPGGGDWAAAKAAIDSLEDYDFQAVTDMNEAELRETAKKLP